jgi:ribosomal protein L39E
MTTKHASEMTDAEFEAASRRRDWRPEPPPKPAPPSAESKREQVRAMTDEQFRAAVARREWRDQ